MPRLRTRQEPPDTPSAGIPNPPVCGMCGHRAPFYVAGCESGPPLTVDLFTAHTRALACGRCRSRVLYRDRAE